MGFMLLGLDIKEEFRKSRQNRNRYVTVNYVFDAVFERGFNLISFLDTRESRLTNVHIYNHRCSDVIDAFIFKSVGLIISRLVDFDVSKFFWVFLDAMLRY